MCHLFRRKWHPNLKILMGRSSTISQRLLGSTPWASWSQGCAYVFANVIWGPPSASTQDPCVETYGRLGVGVEHRVYPHETYKHNTSNVFLNWLRLCWLLILCILTFTDDEGFGVKTYGKGLGLTLNFGQAHVLTRFFSAFWLVPADKEREKGERT